MMIRPKTSPIPTTPSAVVVLGVGDDRAAAREDQRERGEPLGGRASTEAGRAARARTASRSTSTKLVMRPPYTVASGSQCSAARHCRVRLCAIDITNERTGASW